MIFWIDRIYKKEYYNSAKSNGVRYKFFDGFDEQTKNEISFQFNTFQTDVSDWMEGTDAEFLNISKYIRFVDGNIVLGEEGNTLTLQIANDRISFLDAGLEVAYFSNSKLYVTDGEFLHSLQLGNFAFIPRENGNISFKKL